jgi:hypothetical protein
MAPYYHARFVHDLNQNPPELFVDAVGPTSWLFRDRTSFGFEQFPEIARFIADRYIHLLDAYGQRYYLRRDLAAKGSQIVRPKNCAQEAVTCVDTPLRNPYGPGAALVDATMSLPKLQMPAHALIDAQFTPAGAQPQDATVFNNELVPYSRRGFRLRNIGGDGYQLVLGLGDQWAFSEPILLPHNKTASVSIEMNGKGVYIRANGTAVQEMHLPSPMSDPSGPVTLGTWIDGHCRFWGTIQFFQIVDLTRKAEHKD